MKKHNLLALGLAAALTVSLTGCAKTPSADATPQLTDASAPVDTAPVVTPAPRPDAVPEDVTLAATGIPGETTLFTVDGEAVSAQKYFSWLVSCADQYNQYGALDWSMEMEDGQTMAEYLKNTAVDQVKLYEVVYNHAAADGVALSQEDQTSLAAQMTSLMTQMGANLDGADGARAFQYYLGYQAQTYEGYMSIQAAEYLATALRNAYFGKDGKQAPTAEDIDAYVEENELLRAKHILISAEATTDADGNATDDGMAAALEKAQDLRAQLKENNDDEVFFDKLMNAESTDPGLAQNPLGYVFGPGEMVEPFETATKALEIGQVSDPVETDYGYHIILRLDPDTDDTRSLYANDKMTALLTQWLEEAKVETTPEFDTLDAEAAFNKLSELRGEIGTAMEAEFMPQETTTPEETGTPAPTETPVG